MRLTMSMPNPPGLSPTSARCTVVPSTSSALLYAVACGSCAVESRPWVLEVIVDGATGARGGDLDDLLAVEAGSVLHGVDEQLAEGGDQEITALVGRRRLQLGHEADHAIGRQQVGGDLQREPVRRSRDDLNRVGPVLGRQRRRRHGSDLL